jgi:transcriptional regulator GlxA family with amidase domain
MVASLKRAGGHTQFSTLLAGQVAQKTPIRAAQDFIADNLAADLTVGAVANRVGMSAKFLKAVQARGRDDARRLRR